MAGVAYHRANMMPANISRRTLPLVLAGGLAAAATAPPPPAWDTCADTWVATDGLGRSLPDHRTVGPPKANRTVGIFYFLWHEGQNEIHDLSRILAAGQDPPAFGPVHSFHHWGQPLFGYYRQDDRFVIRKHLQMLADAGVDVLILDATNALTYDRVRDELFAVMDEMAAAGLRLPQVAFMANSHSADTVGRLYQNCYLPGKGRAHWFHWQGKPLLLSPPEGLPPDIAAFFTLRHSWAWTKGQPWFGDGRDKWPWLDHFPQTPGWHDAPDRPEQIPVCVAQHPTSTIGRSFNHGKQPPPEQWRSAEGLCFAEQWQHALKVDPPFVLITGWNEWIAQRFIDDAGNMTMAGRRLKPGDSFFVDQYSPEFSRDVEPMAGGFGDAYFYQMIDGIRRYKGVRPLPAVRPAAIAIDGRFADWQAAYPVFRDTAGDPVKRDHPGWKGQPPFNDDSGRHDILLARVSADEQHIYFMVQTRGPLGDPAEPNRMLLFIDADHNPKTGWLGYDFVVNRTAMTAGLAVLESNEGNQYRWTHPIQIPCRSTANQLELAIPRAALSLAPGKATLDFKWADGIRQTGDWSDFTLHGDAAPNDRFNFRAVIP
jgi:hypothetical protein